MQIEVNEYYHTLSCGCCSDFGVDLYLDGIKVYRTFASVSDAYEYVLEVVLGHDLDYYYNKDSMVKGDIEDVIEEMLTEEGVE